jgi:hypothetical protein
MKQVKIILRFTFTSQKNSCPAPAIHRLTEPVQKRINDANVFRSNRNVNTSMKLLIILSGPEPPTQIFEKILLKELRHYHDTGNIRGVCPMK